MHTTDMPPVFHAGHYSTYCQKNLLFMGSDLLLMLMMFFFVRYCGHTIDEAVSTLFFCNSNVMILRPYGGSSSVEIEAVF